jgi:hypothetical protein
MELETQSGTVSALALATLASLLLGTAQTASAIPVNGLYTDDPRCDSHPTQNLPHEIGETTAFPIDERISVVVSPRTTSP